MVSKFDICSRALVELGEDVISSFTANTAPSKICGLIYPQYIRYLLSIHPWKFTTTKAQLARLTTAPLNKWKYAYQLPSDLIIVRAFYTSSNTGIIAEQNYELFENKIYTNETSVYIDYQYQPDESIFPPYFIEFVIKALASKLCLSITDDRGILELKKIEAFGVPSDNLNGGEFGVAKKLDGLQTPSQNIIADDLMAARFS